jgi:ubiquinone/menaquinone biosynthesis C-methylase UbiE
MKRVVIPELLDSDAGTPAEIQAALSDLKRINRWFGGVATTTELIQRIAEKLRRKSLSLLEVAAGSGDSVAIACRRLSQEGITVQAVVADRSRTHLNGTQPAVVSDAMKLPFADNSFDLVSCGLFAHHLEPEQIVKFVEEALRVARLAVLINDLIRHPVHLAMVYAGLPLFRSRLTRHDAPASVRRAYTVGEMRSLLEKTSASRIEIEHHYLFRMGVIAWK